jgi:heme A synthase
VANPDDPASINRRTQAMTELSHIFETELSKHVFVVGTILFMAAAAYAAMFIAGRANSDRTRSEKSRYAPLMIGAMVAVAVLVGGFKVIGSSGSSVAFDNQSISIADIMQRVDTRSLPAQSVHEPY